MAKLFLIGDDETVLGFRFAGIRGHVAEDAPAAAELFRKAIQDGDVRIVVITERIAQLIRGEIDAFTQKRGFPFVVEIADAGGPSPTRKSPSDLVREAIGITI